MTKGEKKSSSSEGLSKDINKKIIKKSEGYNRNIYFDEKKVKNIKNDCFPKSNDFEYNTIIGGFDF